MVARGRVQGVGFRYAALRAARALGALGSVRNREDGAVEIVAVASRSDLDRFRAALQRDMPGRVDAVETAPVPLPAPLPDDFRILR